MKISVKDLKTFKFPYSTSESLDLKDSLIGFEDIIDAGLCEVNYKIKRLDSETYEFYFKIKIDLVVESSISLKRVPLAIESEFEETYSSNKDYVESEDAIEIKDGLIDTTDEIITEILSNKPMSSHNDDEEYVEETSDEEYINPYFAALDDIIKK